MRWILKDCKKISLKEARNLVLIDTCFLIDMIKSNKLHDMLKIPNIAMTSFNIEELIYIQHKLPHHIRKGLKHFLKDYRLLVLKLPVSPGNYIREQDFVNEIEPQLLQIMQDNSDAVLIAAALKTHSHVLTKDRHHIFTASLENFVNDYDIRIIKNLHEF